MLTGNVGFDSSFTDAFAVIGDNAGCGGTASIAGDPTNGINSISQSFALPAIVGSYDLSISFKSAFDGRSDPNATDTFTATLTKPDSTIVTLFSQTSSEFPNCGPLFVRIINLRTTLLAKRSLAFLPVPTH